METSSLRYFEQSKYLSPLILLLNGLSLDVCLIAIIWQHLFANLLEVHLCTAESAVLGLSVWLVYAIDHYFDAKNTASGSLFLRHSIVKVHKGLFPGLFAVVFFVDLFLALKFLSSSQLISGVLLLLLCFFYTARVARNRRSKILIKEFWAALIFSLGILAFLIPKVSLSSKALHLCIALLFTFLIFLGNALLIASWEEGYDILHEYSSVATKLPALKKYINSFLAFPVLVSLLLYCQEIYIFHSLASVGTICCASLVILNLFKNNFPKETLHTLANISLMAPVLLLI